MDIKLKNISYSIGTKLTAAILAWLCFLAICASSVFLIYNAEIATTKSYYDTSRLDEQFSEFAQDLADLNVLLISEDNIKANSVSQEVTSDNLSRFQSIKYKLSNTVNFAYYIKNSQTGEISTNITASDPVAQISKQKVFGHFYKGRSDMSRHMYTGEYINQILRDTPYEVYVAVMEPLKPGDVFYDGYITYAKIKTFTNYAEILLIISILLLLIACIYSIYVAGRKEKEGEVVLSFIDKLYADVHTLWVLLAAAISFMIITESANSNYMSTIIIASIILSIDALIGMIYILSMARQIKTGIILKNTLIYSALKVIKQLCKLCFNGKSFKTWIILLMLGYGFANGILFTIATHGGFESFLFSGLLILVFNIAVVYFAAKSLLSLAQIMEASKEISKGNIEYALDNSKMTIAFSGFAEDIRGIQSGLRRAVAEAVKGERMKTELITNVSHDLKTPLTSIVNYVDLLKKEELNNEKAYEYVSILEEKSARLKQLVEDLVEASKASSGNLTVKEEKVDMHELVLQACGEYEEKIKQTELDVRVNTNDNNTFILADGKYMWRIVENLLSNVIKYSMPNSRVYINIAKNDKYGMLTIKNISAFPLDISPEQLTERFVRGDVSRTTEGSGLGLAIAKSLTDIQNGRFKIEIDGDLFKVLVEMPLWAELHN